MQATARSPERGGGYSICMHIGYVPRERPPFSALNFRSGAYHFHKLPKISVPEHHHFYIFWRILPFPETIIFKISLISTRSSPPTAGSAANAAPRVSSRPERQPDASWQFRRLAFSRSKRIKLVPEPRIFKLKTAQARSGAPHFHARPGARSGARAHFTLPRHIPIPKFGVSTPPPPRSARSVGSVSVHPWHPHVVCFALPRRLYCVFITPFSSELVLKGLETSADVWRSRQLMAILFRPPLVTKSFPETAPRFPSRLHTYRVEVWELDRG